MTVKEIVDKLKGLKFLMDRAEELGVDIKEKVYKEVADLLIEVSNFTPEQHKEFQRQLECL